MSAGGNWVFFGSVGEPYLIGEGGLLRKNEVMCISGLDLLSLVAV